MSDDLARRLEGMERRLANLDGEQIGASTSFDDLLRCPTCSQVVAFRDIRNGEVRSGYRGEWFVRFIPSGSWLSACKRCHGLVEFEADGRSLGLRPLLQRG